MQFLNKNNIWLVKDYFTNKLLFVIEAFSEDAAIAATVEKLNNQQLDSYAYVYSVKLSKIYKPDHAVVLHAKNYYALKIGEEYVKLTYEEASSIKAATTYVTSYVKRTPSILSAVAELPVKIKNAIYASVLLQAIYRADISF